MRKSVYTEQILLFSNAFGKRK